MKMHPIVNGVLRLSGIAPLIGPMPLSVSQHKKLFDNNPSFVDYFPVIDYDSDNQVFLFDDYINVGMGWRLTACDLDAKPEETLAYFNERLAKALSKLPQETEHPYLVQFFLQDAEIDNLGDYIESKLPKHLKKDQLSLKVTELMREHSDLLTHELGAFEDSRNKDNGWRVASQHIYVVLFRKPPQSYWKKQRKTPTQKLVDDSKSFIMALHGIHVDTQPLDDYDLIRWLAPVFSADTFSQSRYTRERHQKAIDVASYDLGQKCFSVAPSYLNSDDAFQRGIYAFGGRYMRYLTTHGLQEVPGDGCLTIGSGTDASVWDKFPPGTMITWTIVPQPKAVIDDKIDLVMASAQQSKSDEAEYTVEQAKAAKQASLRDGERIFYTQIGAYISADSLSALLEKTDQAVDVMGMSQALEFIQPEHDLFSQDTFKYALPFVYDYEHDRRRALRARMTYLSHLAATLPLYGVSQGSRNPCYIVYKRSGEPFMCNPNLSSDRKRVAHQLVFGPTGSGKSATMIYLAMMSMAVNASRQFILDKGNSFGLLADYYQRHGKKVRRYTFNAASKDTFPPFFETEKALNEAANRSEDTVAKDNEEKRSYLQEMLNSLKIMVTGGRSQQAEALTQSDINFLQKGLIMGLQNAHAAGKKHAIISDVQAALMTLVNEEKIEAIAIRFRGLADALELWTQGLRGKLFNQIGEGFDETADLTIIETGALAEEGSEDMFAVAGLATMTNITALGEKVQYEKRDIEVYMDEGHYWLKLLLLITGIVQATKVWRKLGIWMTFATQDFTDFPEEAKQVLTQAENWWLLSMEEEETKQVSRFKDLTDEEHYLIRQATIEKPNYTEATLLSKKFGCGLNRFIPPSVILALAQTDSDEKAARQQVMDDNQCNELDAALIIADQIAANRRIWQNQQQ